jgi:hypothetical protein
VAQVANTERTKAARLEIDKTVQTLQAFDKDNKLIAFYPITAGSTDKPAPSGELKVRTIARNPTYRYNPKYEFKGVRTKSHSPSPQARTIPLDSSGSRCPGTVTAFMAPLILRRLARLNLTAAFD